MEADDYRKRDYRRSRDRKVLNGMILMKIEH